MTSNASSPASSSNPGDAESICERIVFEVADREDVDPQEITVPLYDAVNPDAVESLFRGNPGRLTFTYMGYIVSVTHNYEVTVIDRDTE